MVKHHTYLYCKFSEELIFKISIRKNNYLFDDILNRIIKIHELNMLLYVHIDKNNKYSREFCRIIDAILNKLSELNLQIVYIFSQ